ncbi:MAG: PIG-L family deacetylase [Chloroflexota bacterium]|nr:PIG-L family deacetylase [Chloroflexota bacterium]
MPDEQPALLVFGAHPDDCEFTAAGLAALYARQGGHVCFVSLTNGDAGHHELGGAALARIRRKEAADAASVIGIESRVLDNHDGELLPTLDRRREVIAIIRAFRPDLILTPRPNDYHPDHRYTSTLVQDAAYMVTVPNVVAHAEHLARDPVIMYVSDRFQKPYPFTPSVLVDIGEVVEQKLEMLGKHASQVYEWLPYNGGYADQVPQDREGRRAWLRSQYEPRLRSIADRFRDQLVERYGSERGAAVEYAEAFEACEYGSPLTEEARTRLFPF